MNEVVSALNSIFLPPLPIAWGSHCFAATFASAKQSPSAPDLPKVIYADPRALADAKARFLAGTTSLKPAFDQLFAAAQKALKSKTGFRHGQKSRPASATNTTLSASPVFW